MQMKTTRLNVLVRGVRMAAGLALILAATATAANAGAGTQTYPHVPEIDPGSILSAMTLLSGGVMILTDRRPRFAFSATAVFLPQAVTRHRVAARGVSLFAVASSALMLFRNDTKTVKRIMA
jgi:hypothetical protein